MATRELPARPSLEQYKKQAKELVKAWKAGDRTTFSRIWEHHPRLSTGSDADLQRTTFTLADAQFVIAREHGFDSWPKFTSHIEAMGDQPPVDEIRRLAQRAIIDGDSATLDALLRDYRQLLRVGPDDDARFIIAREHHFESWGQFATHIEALRDRNSPVAQFEAAVDAVITGDISTLERLLRTNADLIRTRSTRTHHAMLLHYVGANGVEDFRQRTPKNAVKVARVILDAGADINAMADMYGGADTLGLVATSIHPITAGVQEELMAFPLSHGALVATGRGGAKSSGVINACLANGRPGAAEFLAKRADMLDLEAAAGIGRLDLVKGFFNADGSLTGGATEQQVKDGFSWACEYGRTDVVDFLLQRGMDVGAKLRPHGQAGLHWAAYGGHDNTVRVLLERHPPVDAKDDTFGGTPLDWALYAWGGGREHFASDGSYDVVKLLVASGATVEDEWLDETDRGFPLAKRISEDPRMRAVLAKNR